MSTLFKVTKISGLLRVILLLPAIAQAQQTDQTSSPASRETVVLDPFTVKAVEEEGFRASDASSATRIAVDLRDAPISISVMSREVLEDLMTVDIKQGLYYGPGITGGTVNRISFTNDAIYRGIVENTVFTDGTPLLSSNRFDEPFELERMEIIRGPSGVTFGAGFFGGLSNRVSKQPLFQSKGEVQFLMDDNNLIKGALDLTGPINSKFAYRVITSYTEGKLSDKLYDDYRHKFIRGALTWRPSASTSVTANFKYRTFGGVFNLMGDFREGNAIETLYQFDTSAYSPTRDLYKNDADETQAWFIIKHSVNDWLTLRTLGAYTKFNDIHLYAVPLPGGTYTNALGAPIPRPDSMLNVVYDYVDVHNAYAGIEQDILAQYDVGITKNKTLLTFRLNGVANGLDENRTRIGFAPFRYKNGPIGIADNFDPFKATPKETLLPLTWADQDRKPAVTTSIQHFMSFWNNRLNLTAGFSREELRGVETATTGTVRTAQSLDFSTDLLRYGLSVRATDWMTVYGQYSEGFQLPAPRVDRITGVVYGPQTSTSKEVGVRMFLLKDRLTVEAAYYEMELAGIIAPYPDPTTQGFFQRGGDVSKGLEIIVQGELTEHLSISASVNHNDYRSSNGERARLAVADYGNIYAKYRFTEGTLKGFSVGVGTWWQFDRLDAYYTDTAGKRQERNLPDAQVVDLVFQYNFKPFTFGVNVTNLLDESYYASTSSDIYFRGNKRHLSFSLGYKF